MVEIRARFAENESLNIDTLKAFISVKNPGAKSEFYARDIVSGSDRFGLNWLGSFAVMYLLTNADPFWVGINDEKYPLEGGTMLRYQAVMIDIRKQADWGEHYAQKTFKFGAHEIEGTAIESLIAEICDFAKAPDKLRPPPPPTPPSLEEPILPPADGGSPVQPNPPRDELEPSEPIRVPVKKSTPFWWKIAKRFVKYGLTAALGGIATKIPIVGEYLDELIEVVLAVLEGVIF